MNLHLTFKNTAVISGSFSFAGVSIESAKWLPNFFMPQGKSAELVGQKFNRLTVISFHSIKHHERMWLCKCDCGNETLVNSYFLCSGRIRSCGCLVRETSYRIGKAQTKHGCWNGGENTPEYRAWTSMNARCTNPNAFGYKRYGGRGIKICERWKGYHGFENFLADMGTKPSPKHSLDRIENNGNYEPSNCRWATDKEQTRNRSSNRYLEYNGESLCIRDWCIKHNVKWSTMYGWLRRNNFDMSGFGEWIKTRKRHKSSPRKKPPASTPQQ